MNIYRIFIVLFAVITSFSSCIQNKEKSVGPVETYRNPVIAGDFPDPTVIKVGDIYYAATSSSEWALPYRVFQSKDLVNWEYVGPIFNEVPDWLTGSFWAPELYYHDNTFYVYYTARRKSDKRSYIGVATSKDPKNGFEDHGLIIEWTSEAIDAFIIDIDGKGYITWKAYGLDERPIEILGAELSDDRLRITGEAFSLLTAESDTWEFGGIEGQCIVKHDDYLYMFYAGAACCGINCNYATGVARAKTIDGTWERFSGNPILHAGDTWKCSGHGTLVETPGNRFFYLYHAYNVHTNVHLGRQVMLDEIIWDQETGWPQFRYGVTPSLQAEVPHTGTVQQALSNFEDSFDGQALKKEWIWDVGKPKPQIRFDDNQLYMQADETPVGNIFGLKPKTGNYTFQVEVENQTNVQSGITLYGNSQNAVGISVQGEKAELWTIKNETRTVIGRATVDKKHATLFVTTRNGNQCQFGWMEDNEKKNLGELLNIDNLPQWDRPASICIHSKGNGEAVFEKVILKWE